MSSTEKTTSSKRQVIFVDDDKAWAIRKGRSLEEAVNELDPKEQQLEFTYTDTLQGLSEMIVAHKARSSLAEVLCALVDLGLPAREGEDPEQSNGIEALRMLREEKIPCFLISGQPPAGVQRTLEEEQLTTWVFRKDHFDQDKNEIIASLNAALQEASPRQGCLTVKAPYQRRGQRRELPLATSSPAMGLLRLKLRAAYKAAAAVLIIGDDGVEFEQVAWLLHEERVKSAAGKPASYQTISCAQDNAPAELGRLGIGTSLAGGSAPAGSPPNVASPGSAVVHVEDVHLLGDRAAGDLAHLLEVADELGSDTVQVVLTGKRDQVDLRLVDLFAVSGYPDFVVMDIPPIAERSEDVEAYVEYFHRKRSEDGALDPLKISGRALELIKGIARRPDSRNFKGLALILDELFRTCTSPFVTLHHVRNLIDRDEFAGTVSGSVMREIAKSNKKRELLAGRTDLQTASPGHRSGSSHPVARELIERELYNLCAQMLQDKEREPIDRELEADLEQIRLAIEIARTLGNGDTEAIDRAIAQASIGVPFWPLTRYPITEEIVRALESMGSYIGLIQNPKSG